MNRSSVSLRIALTAVLLCVLLAPAPAVGSPEGQLTWAFHVSLAPAWFDPAETAGIIAPFKFLYAMHDAFVKSMPGNPLAPSLAESWTVRRTARRTSRPAPRRAQPRNVRLVSARVLAMLAGRRAPKLL